MQSADPDRRLRDVVSVAEVSQKTAVQHPPNTRRSVGPVGERYSLIGAADIAAVGPRSGEVEDDGDGFAELHQRRRSDVASNADDSTW